MEKPKRGIEKVEGKPRYLIGPKYFSKYLFVLKIVLLSVLLGVTVALFVGGIGSHESIVSLLTNFIATVLSALLQGAAWVTVIFAIFEYKNVDLGTESSWGIQDHPESSPKNALISKSESVFSILFSGLFFSILYVMPEWIGIYYKSQGAWVSIPAFNVGILNDFNLIIIFIFIMVIVQESLKIIWGKWTVKRAIINAVFSVVSNTLAIMVFANKSIWNSKFFEYIYQHTGFGMNEIVKAIVLIIVVATIVEIVTDLYKGFRNTY